MAWDVHLHVCFPADKNEPLAALAAKHLALISNDNREAAWFLDDLSQRTGTNYGPKGGLSLWGRIGNHTNAEAFVEVLKPFWLELLTSELDGGPLDFERILVFYEHEQSEAANAFQIGLTDQKELEIKHFPNLPFSWGQY